MKALKKRHRIYQSPRIKIEQLPKSFCTSESVGNIQAQKERFLKHGKTPTFVVKGDTASVEELPKKASGQIRFEFLGEAEYILKKVKEQYGMGENYLDYIYGPRISQEEANDLLMDYINENALHESLDVFWSDSMTCSARMVWRGPHNRCNRPESRRYSLWVNGSAENPYLRKTGFLCLLDHEIGTHFFRTFNDGLQPWFSDRKCFDLRGCMSFEAQCTEEGFAAIHTALRAKEHFLWLPALVYYTACKSTEMNFKQLFDHLAQFVDNPEQRWKHVMRVKRGLVDSDDLGGYGKDQCYFEGAVNILRNIENIDFALLMSGKICYDEVKRIKRLARMNCIRLPSFMRDMVKYREQLKQMAALNGLHIVHPVYQPSPRYLFRLKQREEGARRHRKVRKKKKLFVSLSQLSQATSESQMSSGNATSSESQDSILTFDMNSYQVLGSSVYDKDDTEEEAKKVAQSQTPSGGLASRIGAALMNNYPAKPKEDSLVIVDPLHFVGSTSADYSGSEDDSKGLCSDAAGAASKSNKNAKTVVIPLSAVRNKALSGDFLQKTGEAKHNPEHKSPSGLTRPSSETQQKTWSAAAKLDRTWLELNGAVRQSLAQRTIRQSMGNAIGDSCSAAGADCQSSAAVANDRRWSAGDGQKKVSTCVRPASAVDYSMNSASIPSSGNKTHRPAGQHFTCNTVSEDSQKRPLALHASSERLNSACYAQTHAETSTRMERGKSAVCLPPLSKVSRDGKRSSTEGRNVTYSGKWGVMREPPFSDDVCSAIFSTGIPSASNKKKNTTVRTLKKRPATGISVDNGKVSDDKSENDSSLRKTELAKNKSFAGDLWKTETSRSAKKHRKSHEYRKSLSKKTRSRHKLSSVEKVAEFKLDSDSDYSATKQKLMRKSKHVPKRSRSSRKGEATLDTSSVDVTAQASMKVLPCCSSVVTESPADSVQSNSDLPEPARLVKKRISLSAILSRIPESPSSVTESRKRFEAAVIAQSNAMFSAQNRVNGTTGTEGMSQLSTDRFVKGAEVPETCTGELPGQHEREKADREKGIWKNARSRNLSEDGLPKQTVSGGLGPHILSDPSLPADVRAILTLHTKLLQSGTLDMQGYSGVDFQMWSANGEQSKNDS